MTLENTIEFLNESLAKVGMSKLEIPVIVSKRMTRTLGYFKGTIDGTPINITFSSELFDYGSDETIKQIALHELAHYITFVKAAEQGYELNVGHGEKFILNCMKIGCSNYRPFCTKEIEDDLQHFSTYNVMCPVCGFKRGYKTDCKMIKSARAGELSCGTCNRKLYVKENTYG